MLTRLSIILMSLLCALTWRRRVGFRFSLSFRKAQLGSIGEGQSAQEQHESRSSPILRAQENSRFWSRNLPLKNTTRPMTPSERIEQLRAALHEDPDTSRVDFGVAILPGEQTLLVPLHNGTMQPQHATLLPSPQPSTDNAASVEQSALLCAFSPRARHIVHAPTEDDRPVNPERLAALNHALTILSTTSAEELLSEALAGTPPARIYRSFVAPRTLNRSIMLEPVERAANRTAVQIDLAMRQVRADQAAYLRNTDRAVVALSAESGAVGRGKVHPVVLVLDNIRSAFNVGSIFRTAETAGAAELFTCGITAHPPNPKLRKTAMQAVDAVPTRHYDDVLVCIDDLKKNGYTVAAMETTTKSQVYTKVEYPKKLALVLGNELTGVDTRVMDAADLVIEIPTFGIKNSLCVSSAAPIVLFEVLRQWNS